ncbi:MAG: DUF3179 domain-containing protein [Pseudomonadales bacterium]|nr:DUF3179 domain-containing protein [Halioglobus sp.]MCP5130832.1 DUF3179 domain-containing protein [Pseudomonadales bacterium]
MKNITGKTLFLLCLMGACTGAAAAEEPSFFNDFNVEGGLIAPIEIDHGGPGRDGIPAIDQPIFLTGTQRDKQIEPSDRVMGVSYNGVAKAYPIAILDQHEIVNDKFGDTALTITFSPLSGTGMVFLANAVGRELNFGVSGLIYNSDLLFYDRNTDSLWSQVMKTAVTGLLRGATLTQVPAQETTWAAWSRQHPDSLLLSRDTGHDRDYSSNPYGEYRRLPMVMYPTLHSDWRLPAKTWVIGITANDGALALPFEELDKLESVLPVDVGGKALELHWDKAAQSARAFDAAGIEYPVTAGYWFTWVAFHPTTALHPEQAAP